MNFIPFVLIQIAWAMWILFSYVWLHPFCVHVFQVMLDNSNFSAWQLTGEPRTLYNYADRGTDLLYYVVSLAYALYFVRQLWYLKWVLPFIAYRIIGNVLYLIFWDEILFVVFPNVFGTLFFFYTLLDILKLDGYVRYNFFLHGIVLLASLGISLAAEIQLHLIRMVDSDPPDPDFPDIWSTFSIRLDCLLVLFAFVVYVGLLAFPSFERGTVRRGPFRALVKTGEWWRLISLNASRLRSARAIKANANANANRKTRQWIVVTVPHAVCPASMPTSEHPCDTLAERAARCIRAASVTRRGTVEVLEPFVPSDTSRQECDLNRRWCDPETRKEGARDHPFRVRVRKFVQAHRGRVKFVLDVHSYPPSHQEWANYSLVVLDDGIDAPGGFPADYVRGFVTFMNNRGARAVALPGKGNDIHQEMRTELGVRSMLLEFNEELGVSGGDAELERICLLVVQWLERAAA